MGWGALRVAWSAELKSAKNAGYRRPKERFRIANTSPIPDRISAREVCSGLAVATGANVNSPQPRSGVNSQVTGRLAVPFLNYHKIKKLRRR